MQNKEPMSIENLDFNKISTWAGITVLSLSFGMLLSPILIGLPLLLIAPVGVLAMIYLGIKQGYQWLKAHFEYNKETRKFTFHETSYICERCGDITFIEPDIACIKCGFMKGGE